MFFFAILTLYSNMPGPLLNHEQIVWHQPMLPQSLIFFYYQGVNPVPNVIPKPAEKSMITRCLDTFEKDKSKKLLRPFSM